MQVMAVNRVLSLQKTRSDNSAFFYLFTGILHLNVPAESQLR